MAKKENLLTLQFSLLCLSSFLFFFGFNMILPDLYDHVTSLGGEDLKGLVIALFTLSAGLSRPFSGKLADRVGRIPTMIFGAGVSVVAAVFYPVVTSIAGFFFLRFFHGMSTGFKPTGTSAYVADIVPVARRGEATGILSLGSSIGMAMGPSVGPYITAHSSIDYMFYTSSFIVMLSVVVLLGMKESLQNKERLSLNILKVNRSDFYEKRVLASSLIMLLVVYSFGMLLTVSPDFSVALGLDGEQKGYFFSFFIGASIAVRITAGKLSDKYGRVAVLKISAIVLMAALILIGTAGEQIQFLSGAILYGLGYGIGNPAVVAWTIDLSDNNQRGRAFATMYIALELGIGMGAIVSGAVYANDPSNMLWVCILSAFMIGMGFIFLQSNLYQRILPKEPSSL